MIDMRMRASGTYPGRTHRYWRGTAPLFPFGYGLSYTSWAFAQPALAVAGPLAATASVTLRNAGTLRSDYVVLLLMSYDGPTTAATPAPSLTIQATGCTAVGRTDLVQTLAGYQRVRGLAAGASQRLTFTLRYLASGYASSWAGFGDPVPPCGVYSLRFGADQPVALRLRLA